MTAIRSIKSLLNEALYDRTASAQSHATCDSGWPRTVPLPAALEDRALDRCHERLTAFVHLAFSMILMRRVQTFMTMSWS
jgi:hypothetical protein